MKKGNEKNQENLTLYGFSLVSLHFVGTLPPQAGHVLMMAGIGSSFKSKAAKQTKRKNSLFGCELFERSEEAKI
jgi:hypothetical protein